MQLSDIPVRFPIPFGASAVVPFIEQVPTPSQIGITDGRASLETGFPPDTFTPIPAGGVAPFGKDFNGLLFQTTAWSRWFHAGAPIAFDSAFSSAISGYPKGTVLAGANFGTWWLNLVENNITNPDTGGANWVRFSPLNFYAVDSGVVNSYVASFSPVLVANIVGLPLRVLITHTNTGASTFNPGPGAAAIVRRDGSALIGGELALGEITTLVWNGTAYQLAGIAPASTAAVAAGTDTQSAITPLQLAGALAGNASGYITATGAWSRTIPAGVTKAKVTIGGGGGGGAGGSTTQAGGGGGMGAVGVFFLTGLVPGQSLTGTIGAGGAAGLSGGGSGGVGADTTLLNNLVLIATAKGGTGGTFAASPAGGIGGAIIIGTFAGVFVALQGSYGTDGSPGQSIYGGQGAPGWQGAGAGRAGIAGGKNASAPCAGGGGSYGGIAGLGGTGSAGFILIEWGAS